MNVIFDMDGIIFDSERAYIRAFKKLAAKYGLNDAEKVDRVCHESIGANWVKTREIYRSYFGDGIDYEQYRADVHTEIKKKPFDIKKGVYELFDFLKDSGAKIALASSTHKEGVYYRLEEAKLTSYFDAVICGDMISRSKPDPDIFLAAAKAIDAVPESCYVIEDSFNGIRAAYSASMHPIMVPDILQPDDEIRSLAEVVLPSLLEVKTYLSDILSD